MLAKTAALLEKIVQVAVESAEAFGASEIVPTVTPKLADVPEKYRAPIVSRVSLTCGHVASVSVKASFDAIVNESTVFECGATYLPKDAQQFRKQVCKSLNPKPKTATLNLETAEGRFRVQACRRASNGFHAYLHAALLRVQAVLMCTRT